MSIAILRDELATQQRILDTQEAGRLLVGWSDHDHGTLFCGDCKQVPGEDWVLCDPHLHFGLPYIYCFNMHSCRYGDRFVLRSIARGAT